MIFSLEVFTFWELVVKKHFFLVMIILSPAAKLPHPIWSVLEHVWLLELVNGYPELQVFLEDLRFLCRRYFLSPPVKGVSRGGSHQETVHQWARAKPRHLIEMLIEVVHCRVTPRQRTWLELAVPWHPHQVERRRGSVNLRTGKNLVSNRNTDLHGGVIIYLVYFWLIWLHSRLR